MADNTKRAEKQVAGHRRAISEHIDKYKRYPAQHDKDFALKTIRNAQGHVQKLRAKHPGISPDRLDNWRP